MGTPVPEQPKSRRRRTVYALGRRYDAGVEWIGFIKGADHALQATQIAQRQLGDPEVSAAPWKRLPAEIKRACRAGCVVEVAR